MRLGRTLALSLPTMLLRLGLRLCELGAGLARTQDFQAGYACLLGLLDRCGGSPEATRPGTSSAAPPGPDPDSRLRARRGSAALASPALDDPGDHRFLV